MPKTSPQVQKIIKGKVEEKLGDIEKWVESMEKKYAKSAGYSSTIQDVYSQDLQDISALQSRLSQVHIQQTRAQSLDKAVTTQRNSIYQEKIEKAVRKTL